MLVTTSPRHLAENLIAQAPAGTFAGYVCGDDDVEKKPSPAPYLAAGRKLGIASEDMKYCIAVEDSMSGLRSAAASGATTLGQTGFMRIDNSNGPQFASINATTHHRRHARRLHPPPQRLTPPQCVWCVCTTGAPHDIIAIINI